VTAGTAPGTRSYARTWVRDGAMMVAGLLELGESTAAREFVDWYADTFRQWQSAVLLDARGSDPVAENDSHGEYLYAVAEVWRHTRDEAWLVRHWAQRGAVSSPTWRTATESNVDRTNSRVSVHVPG